MFPEITRDDVFRLETRRLWLRWPRARDAAAHAAIAARREVAEMTSQIPHPLPPGNTDQWVVDARRANAEGHPAVVYLHPWEIDPDQPRIANASALSRLRHTLNLRRTRARLAGLLERFDFGPMRDQVESLSMRAPVLDLAAHAAAAAPSARAANMGGKRTVAARGRPGVEDSPRGGASPVGRG